MHADGYEIATHTANHIAMPAGFSLNDTAAEILGAKRFLSEECGIPEADIRGFRSPYLRTNPLVRQVLHEHGFLYDRWAVGWDPRREPLLFIRVGMVGMVGMCV